MRSKEPTINPDKPRKPDNTPSPGDPEVPSPIREVTQSPSEESLGKNDGNRKDVGNTLETESRHGANGSGVADAMEKKSSSDTLLHFFQNSPDPFLLIDYELNILEMNPAALEMLLQIAGDASLKNFLLIIPEPERNTFSDCCRQVIETGEPGKTVVRFETQKEAGEVFYALSLFKVETGLGVLARDITTQHSSDRSLQENKQLYHNIIENTPQALVLTNLHGVPILANRKAMELLGFTGDEEFREKVRDFTDIITAEQREEFRTFCENLIRDTVSSACELTLLRSDGRLLSTELSAALATDSSDNPRAMILLLRELPENTEQSLVTVSELEEMRKKYNELEQLLHIASHDLRTPIINILGFGGELELNLKDLDALLSSADNFITIRDEIDPIIHNLIPLSLKHILFSAERLDAMLSGLSRLSHVDRAELAFKEIDMNKLLQNVLGTFEYRLQESGIDLVCKQLPSCYGDEFQLSQVFSNLIDNALKYLEPSRRGKVRIYGWRRGKQVTFCVEDNGIGIPQEHQKKIFDVFTRLNPGKGSGEGLGLAIARKIIERHNGEIWLESEPDKGCRFSLTLATTVEQGDRLKPDIEIIIADDDPGNALLLEKNLKRAGILNKVQFLSDGQAARDFLLNKENLFTPTGRQAYLFFLNIHLSKVDGIDILRWIRQDEDLKRLPVIMLSNIDDPPTMERCKSLGCDEILVKPVSLNMVMEVIRKAGFLIKVVTNPEGEGDTPHENDRR